MAFITMLFAGIAIFLFIFGICAVILGIILRIIMLKRTKKGIKKSRALSVISVVSLVFGVAFLLPLTFMLVSSHVPNSIVIEGVTYRSGFYGELYPVFGQVGDIGSVALEKEIIYEDWRGKFRRVDFEGHDWVHSYVGIYAGGTVYCAVDQWQQMCDYYADPNNFKYYYGVGYYMSETSVQIPDVEQQKFDELLAFSNDNSYNPFSRQTNEKAQRISESEFYEGICFYKVSNDGFFMTIKSPMYFVYDGKLWLVFYHDGGRDNGGVEEVVAVEVPDELGQYFIGLIDETR